MPNPLVRRALNVERAKLSEDNSRPIVPLPLRKFVTTCALQHRDRPHPRVCARSDEALWFVAFYATWLRLDFKATPLAMITLPFVVVTAVARHLLAGAFIGPQAVSHQGLAFEDITDVGRTSLVTTGGLLIWALIANHARTTA